MPEIKILEETPISMAELKEEVKEIKKRDTELSFRTAKISEQLEALKIVKPKEADEMHAAITKLAIPRFKDIHIYKIIDLLPQNAIELKNIVLSYSLTISNDNVDKVLEVISEYVPKKK